MSEVAVARPSRPAALRLINGLYHRWPAPWDALLPLDAARAISQAERATGLSNWGEQPFREGLEVLVRSLAEDAQLNLVGRFVLRTYIHRLLTNRLKVEADIERRPEIASLPVHRPLFIIGLPRTGSTLLQRLLARDPAVRSLQTWEMMFPSPPPERSTYGTDPRRRTAEQRLDLLNWMAPEFASVHEWTAGEPEECLSLLQATLVSIVFEMMAGVSSYGRWLARQDLTPPYQYYRRQLQHLQASYAGDHWVLKSPIHLFALRQVLELFPDAVIIQTHRDPAAVLPSVCSYFAVLHTLHSDATDLRSMGPYWLERWAAATDEGLELRREFGEERFMDVHYKELVSDPFGTVHRIYDRFGYDLSPAADQAMKSWHQGNPQHKHGVHKYTLEEFGLEQEGVRRRFARYVERFRL